jgi:hypothetical protein
MLPRRRTILPRCRATAPRRRMPSADSGQSHADTALASRAAGQLPAIIGRLIPAPGQPAPAFGCPPPVPGNRPPVADNCAEMYSGRTESGSGQIRGDLQGVITKFSHGGPASRMPQKAPTRPSFGANRAGTREGCAWQEWEHPGTDLKKKKMAPGAGALVGSLSETDVSATSSAPQSGPARAERLRSRHSSPA